MLQFKQKWMVLTVTGLVKLKALWQKRFIDGNQEQNKDKQMFLSKNVERKLCKLQHQSIKLAGKWCYFRL